MLGWLKTTKVHFIGIGGIGMSGIAEVLLDLGYQVSGSDLGSSTVTEKLKSKGARVFLGHDSSHVIGSDIVVFSSAIDKSNPEVQKALELEIPMIRRAEMLAELMRLKFGIAVAGSHGKTTTTSLVATIFQEAALDATHIIGGIVHNLGGNAKQGNGKYLIAEADESDGSFLLLSPIMAAVTNIDNDHLDHYGTADKIVDAFVDFVNKIPFYGRVALNASDTPTVEVKGRFKRPLVWYGIEVEADYVAKNFSMTAAGSSFDLYHQGKFVQSIQTHLVGRHNVLNTLAAMSISHQAGIEWDVIQRGLLNFQGVGRRLEKLYDNGKFLVVDDYGHHPTEVKATITALKNIDGRKLQVVFEPHRYSRTQSFWKEFQDCFEGTDLLYITPIYPASEAPIPGITSEALVKEMQSKGLKVKFLPNLDGMSELIKNEATGESIFLTLGAGAISKKIREIVKQL